MKLVLYGKKPFLRFVEVDKRYNEIYVYERKTLELNTNKNKT